jgi:hypothetical protein
MPSAGGVHVIIRALCRWHFQPGGGPEYCRACRDDGLPCARGEPGGDGRLCPYREHALISLQEQAWDVLLACQGQLWLVPSGHVIGFDMDTARSGSRGPGAMISLCSRNCCRRPRPVSSRGCVPAKVSFKIDHEEVMAQLQRIEVGRQHVLIAAYLEAGCSRAASAREAFARCYACPQVWPRRRTL